MRWLLICLRRFMRCYLLTVFVTLLVVPLSFFLFEAISERPLRRDVLYTICAVVPAVISLIYVYRRRHNVTSDDIICFIRLRLAEHRRVTWHYFYLAGFMVRELWGAQALANEDQALKYLQYVLSDLDPRVLPKTEPWAKKAFLAGFQYKKIECAEGTDEEQELLSLPRLTRSLASDRRFQRECSFVRKVHRIFGDYLNEYLFICLIRIVWKASPQGLEGDVASLIVCPEMQLLAKAFGYKEGQIANRFARLLENDYSRFKEEQQKAEQQQQEQATEQEEEAYWQERHYSGAEQSSYGQAHYSFGGGFSQGQRSQQSSSADEQPREKKEPRYKSEVEEAYAILGVEPGAPMVEVKKQYRRLTFSYHPDHIAHFADLSAKEKQVYLDKLLALRHAYACIVKAHKRG